jgi:hypothetical protein
VPLLPVIGVPIQSKALNGLDSALDRADAAGVVRRSRSASGRATAALRDRHLAGRHPPFRTPSASMSGDGGSLAKPDPAAG